MRLRLLGSAAGGGYPQWNCACARCSLARAGVAEGRRQDSLAVTGDGKTWYLFNASPDIGSQLESELAFRPGPGVRETPLQGVFLTDGELDHTLGLLLLRQATALRVYATAAVLSALAAFFPVRAVLAAYSRVDWIEVRPSEPIRLGTGLTVRALPLAGRPPRYVASGSLEGDWMVAYCLHGNSTDAKTLYAPGLACWPDQLANELNAADSVLIDGTFWSDDEMTSNGAGANGLGAGHLPISGPSGSLGHLASLPARRKVYVHVNNTNPVLDASSCEYRQLADNGIEVGRDGMEWED